LKERSQIIPANSSNGSHPKLWTGTVVSNCDISNQLGIPWMYVLLHCTRASSEEIFKFKIIDESANRNRSINWYYN